MDNLDALLEQYRISDLSTLERIFTEGRHRRADVKPENPPPESETYFRAGCRRAQGVCAG